MAIGIWNHSILCRSYIFSWKISQFGRINFTYVLFNYYTFVQDFVQFPAHGNWICLWILYNSLSIGQWQVRKLWQGISKDFGDVHWWIRFWWCNYSIIFLLNDFFFTPFHDFFQLYSAHEDPYALGFTMTLMVALIIMVTLVLINLLVALIVSNLDELRSSGHIQVKYYMLRHA